MIALMSLAMASTPFDDFTIHERQAPVMPKLEPRTTDCPISPILIGDEPPLLMFVNGRSTCNGHIIDDVLAGQLRFYAESFDTLTNDVDALTRDLRTLKALAIDRYRDLEEISEENRKAARHNKRLLTAGIPTAIVVGALAGFGAGVLYGSL